MYFLVFRFFAKNLSSHVKAAFRPYLDFNWPIRCHKTVQIRLLIWSTWPPIIGTLIGVCPEIFPLCIYSSSLCVSILPLFVCLQYSPSTVFVCLFSLSLCAYSPSLCASILPLFVCLFFLSLYVYSPSLCVPILPLFVCLFSLS